MNENDSPSKRLGLRLLAIGLWVVTSALGFWLILTVRAIVVRVYAHFAATGGLYGPAYAGGVAAQTLTTIAMAIVCIGVVIGGAEYHLNHFGKPESWRLFARTIAAELSVLVLALFI